MVNLDDPRWNDLNGGYRLPYDPRKALASLERNENIDQCWFELWDQLHHQGHVGEASYLAVPELVRIHASRSVPDLNTYSLVTAIEVARRVGRSPAIPVWLQESYEAAWRQLVDLGLSELRDAHDENLIRCMIAALAIGKGQFTLGRIALHSEDVQKEMMKAIGRG